MDEPHGRPALACARPQTLRWALYSFQFRNEPFMDGNLARLFCCLGEQHSEADGTLSTSPLGAALSPVPPKDNG